MSSDRGTAVSPGVVRQVAAAAYSVAKGDKVEAVDVALDLLELGSWLDTILAAAVYRGRIESVRRVKADRERALPGKAEITYIRADGESEAIETDWLTGEAATAIARRAHAGVGRMATFWKNNDDDPDGKRSQGFRRVVWLVVDEGDA